MEVAKIAMECVDPTCVHSKLGWQSPRISFCQDIQGDIFSPEKRRREEMVDDYSSEFEFCMVQNDADPAIFGQTMLTADELFLDGRLLPLHIPPHIFHQEMDDDVTPEVAADPETEKETKAETTGISQHMNPEDSEPIAESSAEPTAVSSAERASNAVPNLPKSPKLGPRWKEIFKIGKVQVAVPKESEFEETKKGAKKENHNSGFAMKQPFSPRSIWPFSRSSSAGEAKASSASCSLASSRSNSAGDSNFKPKASSAPCSRSNSGGDSKLKARNPMSCRIHVDFNPKQGRIFSNSSSPSSHNLASQPVDPTIVPAQQDTCFCLGASHPTASTTEGTEKGLETMSKPGVIWDVSSSELKNHKSYRKNNGRIAAKEKKSTKNIGSDGVQGSTPTRNKGCASPGRTFRMRSPSGHYGRASPIRIGGRSGAFSGSPGRVGSGKFMIKNLERCTVNSKKSGKLQDSVWPGRQKEGLNGADRTNSYSNGVRVLNVPMCMGHPRVGRMSNNRLFNFGGLFSRKVKECSVEN